MVLLTEAGAELHSIPIDDRLGAGWRGPNSRMLSVFHDRGQKTCGASFSLRRSN